MRRMAAGSTFVGQWDRGHIPLSSCLTRRIYYFKNMPYMAAGETYVGQWDRGQRAGFGHLLSNAMEYKGGFRHGVLHGFG